MNTAHISAGVCQDSKGTPHQFYVTLLENGKQQSVIYEATKKGLAEALFDNYAELSNRLTLEITEACFSAIKENQ
jgi:hypothetical protein